MANTENTSNSMENTTETIVKKGNVNDKLGAKKSTIEEENEGKQSFWARNAKTINIVLIAVLALIVIIFAVYKFILVPRGERASEATQEQLKNVVQQGMMSSDTLALSTALNGNEETEGLLSVIDDYKLTDASSYSAKHYAALCYLKMGQKDEALDMLLSCSKKDDYMWYETQMLIGDLYDEKDDANNAKKYYKEAADGKTDFVAPIALWKLGMICERENNWAEAFNAYSQIKDNYAERYAQMGVDKYYERAKAKAGK